MQNKVFILVGPSGCGKTTAIKYLTKTYSDIFQEVSLFTSRSPRIGVDESQYRFLSRKEMENLCNDGDLLEFCEYDRELYGTSGTEISNILGMGLCPIKAMEANGAKSVKERYGDKCIICYIDRLDIDIVMSIFRRKIPLRKKLRRVLLIRKEKAAKAQADYVISNAGKICDMANKILVLVY